MIGTPTRAAFILTSLMTIHAVSSRLEHTGSVRFFPDLPVGPGPGPLPVLPEDQLDVLVSNTSGETTEKKKPAFLPAFPVL